MAIKKAVNISNGYADEGVDAATQMDQNPNDDFAEAPLTPEQQREKDTLDGHNAALRAINGAVPEINKLNHSIFKFKSDMTFADFLKLSPEEQKAQFLEAQAAAKKRKVNIQNSQGDDTEYTNATDTTGL
ncbi:MAG TPA: hypothetical protein VFM18_09795 [Methanosarcina sp.]|nr:hypothetical protein [Methanosarcina sp.]